MLQPITDIVKDCGQILLTASRESISSDDKNQGKSNFVTKYDLLVQNKLQAELKTLYPYAGFLGEEDVREENDAEYVFVIDPIDGTTNFINHYNLSSISVGLLRNGKPVLGVVYNPYLDELYAAEKGKGAFCNGAPIHTAHKPMKEALFSFGTACYYPALCDRTWEIAKRYYQLFADARRLGSAALELCAVASGRAGCFFELMLSPWDFCGGACILAEAGGLLTDPSGNELTDFFKKQPIYARADSSIPLLY